MFTPNDKTNRALGNSVFGSNGALRSTRSTEVANSPYVRFAELCVMVVFSFCIGFTRPVPTLCEHILRVVFHGTNEQMLRVQAAGPIAFVKATWLRPFTVFQEPRDSMRVLGTELGAYSNAPVPFYFRTRPVPALRTKHRVHRSVLVDFAPEARNEFLIHGNHLSFGSRSRSSRCDAGATFIWRSVS